MSELLEAAMVVCFGISWPVSIYKSFTSKTVKGKSLTFLIFIFTGYIFGIVSKWLNGNITYVLFFYIINAIMVLIDLLLYIKNRRLDKNRIN